MDQALVDDPRQCVAGAFAAAGSLIDHFKAVNEQATKKYQNLVPKISQLESQIQTLADNVRKDVREKSVHATDLCQLRLLDLVLRSVAVCTRQVAGELQPVLDQVAQPKGDLSLIAATFQNTKKPKRNENESDSELHDETPSASNAVRRAITEELVRRKRTLWPISNRR